MVDVIVFHHALGITPGVESFATELRNRGYHVLVPDLFQGRVFDSIEDGVAHAELIGFDTIIDRGVASVDEVERRMVVIGFSLGVLPAQKLAQTRPDVVAAILCHSAVPLGMFADAWPSDVALHLHLVEGDPWVVEDIEAAHELAATAHANLFLYEGTGHLVADASHRDYDPAIASKILKRTLDLLADLD